MILLQTKVIQILKLNGPFGISAFSSSLVRILKRFQRIPVPDKNPKTGFQDGCTGLDKYWIHGILVMIENIFCLLVLIHKFIITSIASYLQIPFTLSCFTWKYFHKETSWSSLIGNICVIVIASVFHVHRLVSSQYKLLLRGDASR